MPNLGRLVVLYALALVLRSALPASAQCLEWDGAFDFQGGVDGLVSTAQPFDDGTGLALYVGGSFATAGTVAAHGVARWDGASWSPLGTGTNGSVSSLAVFDDGTGPALYAGGSFTSAGGVPANKIARWDGLSWSPLGIGVSGGGTPVSALAVFDDGSGPALYVAGSFQSAGGVAGTNCIARWDGAAWTSVGGGANSFVYRLTVFDDGTGPALYAGGEFNAAGGVPAPRIAKWDGSTWSALGSGMNYQVRALAVFDDGTGPAMYAGGRFSTAGGAPAVHIARWDGVSWSALGAGVGSGDFEYVLSLAAFDDGTGPALYAGGNFATAGGAPASHVARWNGLGWSPLGSGANGHVLELVPFDDGSGPALFAGGSFTSAGGTGTPRIAKWSTAGWEPIVRSPGQGMSDTVRALSVHDDGGGPALYAAGDFTSADDVALQRVARWTGAGWAALGDGLTGPGSHGRAIASFDDGSGPALYVGGRFTSAGGVALEGIARWDGASWSALGAGIHGEVNALAEFAGALYVGGPFVPVVGCGAGIARWDGASWSCLGTGLNNSVNALAVFDDGGGAELYVGGPFTAAGGAPAAYIARWDGASWSALGAGVNNHVFALAVYDDGTGPALYACGAFTSAGSLLANGIARWDGSGWSALGSGVLGLAKSLAVFDDGSGEALYVGGDIVDAGGAPANGLARWNGSTWTPLAGGLAGSVLTLAAFDDGTGGGADLFVGGEFLAAGSTPSSRIARWHGCSSPGTRFCFGDASAVPCPCGNSGEPAHGCENSGLTGGALLYTTGATVPDTVVLLASGELPTALSIFLQGNAVIAPAVFGDGLRCAGGILKRLYVKNAVGGFVHAPEAGDPSITQQSANLGDPIPPGERRYYQVYYRDPSVGFCPPPQGSTFNVTGAVKVVW